MRSCLFAPGSISRSSQAAIIVFALVPACLLPSPEASPSKARNFRASLCVPSPTVPTTDCVSARFHAASLNCPDPDKKHAGSAAERPRLPEPPCNARRARRAFPQGCALRPARRQTVRTGAKLPHLRLGPQPALPAICYPPNFLSFSPAYRIPRL